MIPNTFQVPHLYVDRLLPLLLDSELRVLLYMVRQVFEFKRSASDVVDISHGDLVAGRMRDGKHLDHGAGVKLSTAKRATKALCDYGIVVQVTKGKGRRPSTWSLQLDEDQIDWQGLEDRRSGVTHDTTTDDRSGVTHDTTTIACGVTHDTTTESTYKDLKTKTTAVKSCTTTTTAVVVALGERGIAAIVAKELVKKHGEKHIKEKIAYRDWLLENAPNRIKAPAGWLRAAIENDYAKPDGFGDDGDAIEKQKRRKDYLPEDVAELARWRQSLGGH